MFQLSQTPGYKFINVIMVLWETHHDHQSLLVLISIQVVYWLLNLKSTYL